MSGWKIRLLAALAAAALLSGCASVPDDRGYADVRTLVSSRGGPQLPPPDGQASARTAQLLAEPLTVDRALAVGLVRNPRLRATYARLGLAQAEVLEAGRLSNPTLSVSVLQPDSGGEGSKRTYGLVQNFTDVLFLSARTRAASRSVEATKLAVASEIQGLLSGITAAYYRTVGAQQVAQMRAVIAKAAGASAELAKRFHDAGNINELQWKREQAAATSAQLAADEAQAELAGARSELNSLMGLTAGERAWTIDARLSPPVASEATVDELLALAAKSRLDLAGRRLEIESLESVRSLSRKLRWIPLLEVGVEREHEPDGSSVFGPTFSFEVPLFNQGQARTARLEALVEQAQAETELLESDIGNDVVAAYERMGTARARVDRHLRELIPQREAIVARTQELQNYMIVGQFELLVAKQDEYDAYQNYLEALRDYWLARVELARKVGARLPSDDRIEKPSAAATILPEEAPAAGHGGHQMHMPQGHEDYEGHRMENMDHDGTAKKPAPQKATPKKELEHGDH